MSGTMKIKDYREVGRFFISMAKGDTPVPQTTEEAIEALEENGVELDGFTTVTFHEND